MASNLLVFSPYASRPHLTAYEGTIAKGCQLRGAKVKYLLCDGLLPECDMHWDSFCQGNYPRPSDLCEQCRAGAKAQVDKLVLPYRWLGEFIGPSEKKNAFAWTQSVSPSEMRQAVYMGNPVGHWVQSSITSYFRQYPPDVSNPRVADVYRGFLFSASLVVIGLNRYLDQYPIDAALLFNGRQSLTRVAFELFRQRGIRVLTHEIPFFIRGHIMVKPNARCWSYEPFNEFWNEWGKVPLTTSALEKTKNWLIDRRYAKGTSWYAYNPPHLGSHSLKEDLNLDRNKKLMVLFTSSTDETAGDLELQGPYEFQTEWVQDVVDWVKHRTDVELVIRVHPNLAGKTGLMKATDEFTFYNQMKSSLPENIRIVMPDDPLNSYALMDEADVGLSFGSSTGIEMVLLGKPVVLASRAFYENGAHILNLLSRESLPAMLAKSLEPCRPREIRREAFRLAYYNVFEFESPFPLVTVDGVLSDRVNYSDFGALATGCDRTLDHICRYLVDGAPLFDSPSHDDLSRSTDEEDAFFDSLERSPTYLRNARYDRWLPHIVGMKKLGWFVSRVVRKMPLGTGEMIANAGRAIYHPFVKWFETKV